MFSEEELEGCPSVQFEEFVNQVHIELKIREVGIAYAQFYQNYSHSTLYVKQVLALLIEAYNTKKCPYA